MASDLSLVYSKKYKKQLCNLIKHGFWRFSGIFPKTAAGIEHQPVEFVLIPFVQCPINAPIMK